MTDNDTLGAARLVAFKILVNHPDCLRDDVSLNELIEDIATAIAAPCSPDIDLAKVNADMAKIHEIRQRGFALDDPEWVWLCERALDGAQRKSPDTGASSAAIDALKFYADPEGYALQKGIGSQSGHPTRVAMDGGKLAREALALLTSG